MSDPIPPMSDGERWEARQWGCRFLVDLQMQMGTEWTFVQYSYQFPIVLQGIFRHTSGRRLELRILWDEERRKPGLAYAEPRGRPGFNSSPLGQHTLSTPVIGPAALHHWIQETLLAQSEADWEREQAAYHAFRAPGEQLAQEIAVGLGPEWVGTLVEERDGFGPYVIELVNGNARVHFAWKEPRITAGTHYQVTGRIALPLAQHASVNWPVINISRQKSSAQIAREIERRLLPAFLAGVRRAERNFAAYAASVQLTDHWARRLTEASAGQLEGKLPDDELSDTERLSYWPRDAPGSSGQRPNLRTGGERLELRVQAESSYNPGVELTLHLRPGTAERLVHFLWEQGFFAPPQEMSDG